MTTDDDKSFSEGEKKILQNGATKICSIASQIAFDVANLHSDDFLSKSLPGPKPCAVRAIGTIVQPAIMIIAGMIGCNKKGEVSNNRSSDPSDYIHSYSIMFASMLVANMNSELCDDKDSNLSGVTVEFGPQVFWTTLTQIEKILGPADGKIDPELIKVAREAQRAANSGAEMLNRLISKMH